MSVIDPRFPFGADAPVQTPLVPGQVVRVYRYRPRVQLSAATTGWWMRGITMDITVPSSDYIVQFKGYTSYLKTSATTLLRVNLSCFYTLNGSTVGAYNNLFSITQSATALASSYFSSPVLYRHRPGEGLARYRFVHSVAGPTLIFNGAGVGQMIIAELVYLPGSVQKVENTQAWQPVD